MKTIKKRTHTTTKNTHLKGIRKPFYPKGHKVNFMKEGDEILQSIGRKPFIFDIENIINDVQDNVLKDLKDANVSIKVESNGEKVEINANTGKESRENELEELEQADTLKNDTLRKEK